MSRTDSHSVHENNIVPPISIPPLRHGDRLSREEFERRYDAMPHLKKAQLVEGVVYMPSPVRHKWHGRPNHHLSTWLGVYEATTPGVEGSDNSTVRLDTDNELQPDLFLLIDPNHGGQATITDDGYVESAPELVVEIAASSGEFDLKEKKEVYRRHGVREYIVWRVLDEALDWFVLRDECYETLTPESDGLLKSNVFPGLWLDSRALLKGDLASVLAVVQQGTATAKHAEFAERLAK